MACAGFILAGAETFFRGGRLAPEGREKIFCPPCFVFCPPPAEFDSAPPAEYDSAPSAEFNSAPRAEQTIGGQKTLLYLEKEGETFNDRSFNNPQLTVLFF